MEYEEVDSEFERVECFECGVEYDRFECDNKCPECEASFWDGEE